MSILPCFIRTSRQIYRHIPYCFRRTSRQITVTHPTISIRQWHSDGRLRKYHLILRDAVILVKSNDFAKLPASRIVSYNSATRRPIRTALHGTKTVSFQLTVQRNTAGLSTMCLRLVALWHRKSASARPTRNSDAVRYKTEYKDCSCQGSLTEWLWNFKQSALIWKL